MLMVLVLLIGCGLGWIVHRARVQRDAVAAIERAGGSVRYDWGLMSGVLESKGQPSSLKGWVDRVGVDYFGNVTWVTLLGGSDPELAFVRDLNRLEQLNLTESSVTDAG